MMQQTPHDLTEQLNQISNRLTQLENHLGLNQKKPAPDEPVMAAVKSYHYELPQTTSEKSSQNTTKAEGLSKLLGVVAAICFVIAGLFVVRLAVDSGWLTPPRQLGFLILFGLILSFAGRLIDSIDRDYRIYLSAAGNIILYLASYSSYSYFKVVSQEIGLVLAVLTSINTLWMFHFHRSEAFSIIAVVGTFLIPYTLDSNQDFWFISFFFLIWSSVFSYCSTFFKSRTLSLTAAYAAIGVFASLHLQATGTENLIQVVLVQSLQFVIFVFGVVYYSVKNKERLSFSESVSYFPILMFFYATSYYFIHKISPILAPWISLLFSGFIWLFYILAKQNLRQFETLNSKEVVYTFLGVSLVHAGYFEILPESGRSWILPLLIIAEYISRQKSVMPSISKGFRTVMFILAGLEFLQISFSLLSGKNEDILPALFTVGLGLFYYLKISAYSKDTRALFLNLMHLFSILTFYRLVFDFGSLAVTGVWALYAGIILYFGFQRKDQNLAYSSLVVFIITALKALVYDASHASSVIRVACLIMTGVILYVAGLLFSRVQKWDQTT